MAQLRRKGLHSEHQTRLPLVSASTVGTSAQWLNNRLEHVVLTLRGNEHRYEIRLDPEDCDRVRQWLVEQALGLGVAGAPLRSEQEPMLLRELADLLERAG